MRVSAAIDEEIRQERAMAKKRKVVKLLLLGQSESGWLFFLFCFVAFFLCFIVLKNEGECGGGLCGSVVVWWMGGWSDGWIM